MPFLSRSLAIRTPSFCSLYVLTDGIVCKSAFPFRGNDTHLALTARALQAAVLSFRRCRYRFLVGMDGKDARLGALPDTDETLEVVGYGRVRRPPGSATEIQIRLHLAPVGADDRFEEGAKKTSCWIGCGQLPLVPIGSRWRQRARLAGARPWITTAMAVCLGTETVGRSMPNRGDAYYPFDAEPETRCYRLQLNGDAKQIAIVPILEVVRAVFGCSSRFLRQLFDGQRDPNLFKRRFLFDRGRSAFHESTVDLWCHSKPTEREAYLAALIKSSRAFSDAHDGVFSGLQGARGFSANATPFVETPFPFDTPIDLAFESRIIDIEFESQMTIGADGVATPLRRRSWRRNLITRILAYTSDTPFNTVAYDWPTMSSRSDLPPRRGRTMFGRHRRVLVDSGAIPSSFRAKLGVKGAGASATSARDIRFVPRPRLLGERAPAVGGAADLSGEAKTSTADARSDGDKDVAPLEVEARGPAGASAAALGPRARSIIETDQAIRWLLDRRNWTAVGIADVAGQMPPLTRVGDGERSFDVAELVIATDRGQVLIVEAGSYERHRHALGVVARSGMAPFTPDALDALRDMVAAERACWGGRRLAGFAIGRVVRGAGVWEDRPWYAGLIERAVGKVVSKALASP